MRFVQLLLVSIVSLFASVVGAQCPAVPRVFMTNADPALAATTGNTQITMAAGTTTTVSVWLEGACPGFTQLLNGYQLIWPDVATPQGGATGSVIYEDVNPGMGGGDTLLVDSGHPNWVLAGVPTGPPVYNETPGLFMGMIQNALAGQGLTPASGGLFYLGQFDLRASAAASGSFDFDFNSAFPPLTALFTPVGSQFTATTQAMTITIGTPPPTCPAQPRVFLTNADPAMAATTGNTQITMAAGTTTTVSVWLEGACPSFTQLLNGYQLIWPDVATPQASATGTVIYEDVNPGMGGGDTLFVDTGHPNWVFPGLPTFPAVYNETPGVIMGFIYNTLAGQGLTPATNGLFYLGQFDLRASSSASGSFDLDYNNVNPPFSALFTPVGSQFFATMQPLTINVTPAAACPAQPRVFMTNADPAMAATTGSTQITMTAGTTTTVSVWLEGACPSFTQLLNGYQLIWPDVATPQVGATGSVVYEDVNPGMGGGDTLFVDTGHPDFVLAGLMLGPAVYNETPGLIVGLIQNAFAGQGLTPATNGLFYMGQLDLRASPTASGSFDFDFNTMAPPITALFTPVGAQFMATTQPMTITVAAAGVPGDANGDGSVNIADAVYLLAFLFQSGPMPMPCGDPNGDGSTNIADAVYLLVHLFNGGPPPVGC